MPTFIHQVRGKAELPAAALRVIVLALLAGSITGCPDDDVSLSQFRVLSWNAANCDRNGAAKNQAIANVIAQQAKNRFANVIMLQEISEHATDLTQSQLGSAWECAWRQASNDGIATCVEGKLYTVGIGNFEACEVPPAPVPYGTCPTDNCFEDGFGWLQVQYKSYLLTNVHVRQGGANAGAAQEQIARLHQEDIVRTGIVAGDFNWQTPHLCAGLALDSDAPCEDWFQTNNAPIGAGGRTLRTDPSAHDRRKIDHILTIEEPVSAPFSQVLGFGQEPDSCIAGDDDAACTVSELACSNHCMVFASFSLPPPNISSGPATP